MSRSANKAATESVERHTQLTGGEAEKAARYAVYGARPKLEAAFAARLLGTSKREAVTVMGSAVAMLGLNLVVAVSVIRRGGRLARLAAGTAVLGHLGFYAYGRAREHRLRTALKAKP